SKILLAERGLDISYETVRRWVLKFGPLFAREPRATRGDVAYRVERLSAGLAAVRASWDRQRCSQDPGNEHRASPTDQGLAVRALSRCEQTSAWDLPLLKF